MSHHFLRHSVLAMSLLGFLHAAPAGATTLTFDIAGVANFSLMDQNYGDRVTAANMGIYGYGLGAEGATGNVLTSYTFTNFQANTGDLINTAADFENVPSTIRFDADPGFLVHLLGFDLATGSTLTLNGFSVSDGVNLLYSSGLLNVPGATHLSFSGLTLSAPTLILSLDNGRPNGAPAVAALDNILLSQSTVRPVPEPGTLALVGVGLIGFVAARRRRRAVARRA